MHTMTSSRAAKSEGWETMPGARMEETAPPTGFETALGSEEDQLRMEQK